MRQLLLSMCFFGVLVAAEMTQCELEEQACKKQCMSEPKNNQQACSDQCRFSKDECDQDSDDTDEDVTIKGAE